VEIAFLYGTHDEEIYMALLDGDKKIFEGREKGEI
jgi:hypothetical protein